MSSHKPRVSRRIVWGAALIGLLLIAGCFTGRPTAARIVVEPSEVDFGEIAADQPAISTLQVLNAGAVPLHIEDIRTSCGCTVATLAQDTLAPGEQTALSIRFDPQAHPGLYGPLLRLVYLASNDPATPELEIPVHVSVMAPVTAAP